MEPKHSALGITSFILSIVVGGLILVTFLIAGVMEMRSPEGMDERALSTVVIGLAIIGLILMELLAFGIGVGGLFQKASKKLFALLGIIVSSLTLIVTLGLIVLGNLAK